MKPEEDPTGRHTADPGNETVHNTGNACQQHPGGKRKRLALMVEVRLPERTGVIKEEPPKHACAPATNERIVGRWSRRISTPSEMITRKK